MRGSRTTSKRCKLHIPLTHPAGCNVLVVKLINQARGGGQARGWGGGVRGRGEALGCCFNGVTLSAAKFGPPLIAAQENMMHVFGDPHTWPNLDMTWCLPVGRMVRLPEGVVVVA